MWVLGLAALLNDASSEMITPLLPVFLSLTLGAGPAVIGLIEGIAEATSSLFKVISGRWVDQGAPATRLVIGGYAVSVSARPWMGLAGLAFGWPIILVLRFLDRVGKGLRTSPRDALIAELVAPGARGRAFGVHRSLDHAGAVIGPLLASGLLAAGWPLRSVFLFAAVPGALVLVNLFAGLRPDGSLPGARDDVRPNAAPEVPAAEHRSADPIADDLGLRASWRALPSSVRGLILGGGVLAMMAMPEMLLVLWATSAGIPLVTVPLLWAGLSVLKMASAYPAGWAVDRFGVRIVLSVGWSARVCLLGGLALAPHTALWAVLLLGGYSIAVALCEPAERAWIGDATRQGLRGRAYGSYHMVVGLAALPGAALLGALWQWRGPTAALLLAAGVTALAAGWLVRLGGQPATVRSK